MDIKDIKINNNKLNIDLEPNLKILGKSDKLIIDNYYDQLDLSELICYEINIDIEYINSIYKLPNSLKMITILNKNNNMELQNFNFVLPNGLKSFFIRNKIKINKLPELPNSLKDLRINIEGINEINNLPNSLNVLLIISEELHVKFLPNKIQVLIIEGNINLKLHNNIKYLSFKNTILENYYPLPSNLLFLKLSNMKINKNMELPISLFILAVSMEKNKYISDYRYYYKDDFYFTKSSSKNNTIIEYINYFFLNNYIYGPEEIDKKYSLILSGYTFYKKYEINKNLLNFFKDKI